MEATITILPPSTSAEVSPESSSSTTSTTSAAPSSTAPSSADLHAQELISAFALHTPTHPNIHLTVGTTEPYITRLATLASHSYTRDPLTTLFTSERFNLPLRPTPISPSPTQQPPPVSPEAAAALQPHILTAFLSRLHSKLPLGAFILEANDFAAAVCWEPPACILAQGANYAYSPEILAERPLFARFLEEDTKVKRSVIGEGEGYWHVSMMARDFGRGEKVPGLVRAVLEPGLEAARRGGEKVWLEASTERSRDVYAHAGFEVAGVFWSGVGLVDRFGGLMEGGEGMPTWGMVFDPLKERGRGAGGR